MCPGACWSGPEKMEFGVLAMEVVLVMGVLVAVGMVLE